MDEPEEPKTIIGFRTAMLLYALVAVIAAYTLKGNARYLVLIIVVGMAAKTYLNRLKKRID